MNQTKTKGAIKPRSLGYTQKLAAASADLQSALFWPWICNPAT